MEVVRLNDKKPPVDVATAIGLLFKKLDNLPQAERWLKIAAENEDLNALPAQFALLEIYLNRKQMG